MTATSRWDDLLNEDGEDLLAVVNTAYATAVSPLFQVLVSPADCLTLCFFQVRVVDINIANLLS